MRRIFISYRREDAEGEAGRLFDNLVSHFGEASIFLDVAAITVGRDFRKAIDESVTKCAVLLAIIGPDWIDARDEDGNRRLDDPSDFVRLETASALKRDIPVIPVLIHGAKMPRPEQLPEDLKELPYRNCVELTHARWRSDIEMLIKALHRHVEDPKNIERQANKPVEGGVVIQPLLIPAQGIEKTPRSDDMCLAPWWKSRGAILTFILGAAVTLAAGVYWLWPRQPTVPDLSGSTLPDAVSKLEAASLVVGSMSYQQDAQNAPNTVLSQSPPPNTRVQRRTAIDLVLARPTASVAAPRALVEVPRLTGKSLPAAKTALGNLHLAVGSISQEPRPDVAQNTVLDEFPKPGKDVERGTAVDLVVSQVSSQPAPDAPPVRSPVTEKAVESPPSVMHWCAAHCSTWTLDSGPPFDKPHYGSMALGGMVIVELWTRDSIVMNRIDHNPTFQGTAILRGRLSGDGNSIVGGTIEWTSGNSGTHPFQAAWGPAINTVPGSDAERAAH